LSFKLQKTFPQLRAKKYGFSNSMGLPLQIADSGKSIILWRE
jgi:hypothetical protein